MDLLAPVRSFDRFQRRHAPLAVTIAVLRNFSDQEAGNASALIAYWAFFSIFPLLLLFVTILGLILQGDPSAKSSVVHSALSQFPIVGAHPAELTGNAVALTVGLLGALLSGLGVTLAAENAFNRVYTVAHRRQPNFLIARWRGLKLLIVVGLLQVLSTVAAGVVSGGLGGGLVVIAGIAVSLLLNLVLFLVVFRFLVSDTVPTRELWPGIILTSIAWEILQAVGGLYVHHVVKGASETYGTFATVIGLLTWLYLGARIVVYAAEINVVLTRRLWPRSIMEPPEPADRKARAALAKMEERDDKETVQIDFHPPADDGGGDRAGEPIYAVAPAPHPHERAQAVSPEIAAPDLHTVTIVELLDAIAQSVEEIAAERSDKQQARRWITSAREALPTVGGEAPQTAGAGAARVLAQATARTLGLPRAEHQEVG
ncbi:MAG: YihY/virulence factor BrkB family protein [Solirubrobacteraceae bacterium]